MRLMNSLEIFILLTVTLIKIIHGLSLDEVSVPKGLSLSFEDKSFYNCAFVTSGQNQNCMPK